MNLNQHIKSFLLVIILITSSHMFAQADTRPVRILFVVDASRSMLATWDRSTRMYTGKEVVDKITDSLNNIPNLQMAMRIYGHQSPQPLNDCEDSKLEVGFKIKNAKAIQDKLDLIRPQGVTPIAYSLEQSIGDFGADAKNYRNVLILVSDGFESCGLNPCEVVLRMRNAGIITKSYVIGIGIDETDYHQFSCMGEFMNIPSDDKTQQIADMAIARILNAVFTRVDLLDVYDEPTETDLVMTFYDSESGQKKYNYYHTINPKGVPDSVTLNPDNVYNLEIHSTPPVMKKNVSVTPGQMNVITESTPQGYIKIAVRGETFKGKINCIIRQNNSSVIAQISNNSQKLLVGTYDIEILTLPVVLIKNVEVEQNKTTTVEIQAPGYVTFLKNDYCIAAIYEYKENLLDEVFELSDNNLKETLAIQPGKYKVIYRFKNKRDMVATKEIEIEVVSGTSQNVGLK